MRCLQQGRVPKPGRRDPRGPRGRARVRESLSDTATRVRATSRPRIPSARSSWIAVSGVMAALPVAISLIVLRGRAIRRPSSACDIPRSSRASLRTSPGDTAQLGFQGADSVMVVNDLDDPNGGHTAFRRCRQPAIPAAVHG